MYEYTIYKKMRRAGWVAMVSYDTLQEATTEVDRKVEELDQVILLPNVSWLPYEEQPYAIVKEVKE